METLSIETLLETINTDVDARLTREQILAVMDSFSALTDEQKSVMDTYFKRVPYSHPRWWR